MKNRHHKALELDKILSLLATETACADAAELAEEIEPSSALFEVNQLLSETSAAHMLIGRFGSPSFGGIKNMNSSVRRAEAGASLTMLELLRIAEVLRVMRALHEWRKHSAGIETAIDWRFDALCVNKYMEERIAACIESEDQMADNASPELAAIRRKIKNAMNRAREQLDKMIRSTHYQKYLQDSLITLRGGRFVVPVKAECRADVPGLVHDTSASGATIFVEPMGVVEANNEIRVLQSQEEAEIERILLLLSSEVGGFADAICEGYNAVVELNLVFAKAHLAYTMKASLPVMNDKGRIRLTKARHPLIDPKKVVPTDIQLGIDFDTLVITGPNTGGKTVSIKTVGLLSLMAMCGLMVPAYDDNELSVFDNVLADIGDEQSIEQSLSTFSSHMTNIIQIVETANPKSLILLDELGAGTDPVEGAALATSILEHLRSKGAKLAATTHYAELKVYALETPGVENGCCEFDVATLRPTYRLLIGVPGRSNAFAISERLGMPHDIVEHAQNLISSENSRFEEVVGALEKSRQSLESERKEAQQLREEAEKAKDLSVRLQEEMEKVREKEAEKAKQEASMMVARARQQAQSMIDEIDDMRKKQKYDASAAKARLKAGLKALEETTDPIQEKEPDAQYQLPRPLKIGDPVLIYDIDKNGTVLELPDSSGYVVVQAGIIKTKVKLSNLRLLGEQKKAKIQGATTRNVKNRMESRASTELDLRGQMAMDAELELDRFIDSTLLLGIHEFTVIHGKGTGALRAAVHKYLKTNPSVRSFRLGNYGEGEAGVTIVELK